MKRLGTFLKIRRSQMILREVTLVTPEGRYCLKGGKEEMSLGNKTARIISKPGKWGGWDKEGCVRQVTPNE